MQVYDLFKWEIAHSWALSKDPSAPAGVTNSPYSCPLAQCFSELLDQPVKVWRQYLVIGSWRYPEPVWIEKAIDFVDDSESPTITVSQFIHILEKVRPPDGSEAKR